MIQDPISDMLTRIRNASMVKKSEVVMPYSRFKMALAELLKHEGYIKDVIHQSKGDEMRFDTMKILLKYEDNKPKIQNIKRVSRPSLRIYRKKEEMPIVLNGYGIAVVSTPHGLMTNKQARRRGVGGEIVCEVY